MTKEAYGVDHFLLTLLYLNAGNSLVKLTKYDSAITKYKMALNLAIGSLGKVHATISQIYNNLGDLFFFQTKYDSALINYKKAINACNYKYKDFQSTNSMLQR